MCLYVAVIFRFFERVSDQFEYVKYADDQSMNHPDLCCFGYASRFFFLAILSIFTV